MSTTIGLGFSAADENGIFDELRLLSEKYGYGLLNGIEFAESDVRSGLEVMKKNEGWKHLYILQSPIRPDVGLAFGIYEELMEFEVGGSQPKFFEYIVEVAALLPASYEKTGIFFAGEWYENDRVKYSYGNIERLICILSLPGNWGTRYMIPETGHLQDSDEIPFVFDLVALSGNKFNSSLIL